MDRGQRWLWLLPALPLALALFGAAAWQLSGRPNPIVYLRASAANLLLFLGLILSLLSLAALFWWRTRRREAKKLAEQEAQLMAERRRFLRRLDHELKNPLTAIRAGLANYENAPGVEMRESALNTVESQAIRLSRLTADLRKISELESRELVFAPVDLNQLLPEVMDLVKEKPGAETRRMVLTLPQAPRPLPSVSGDWDLLFLAMYNLLDNALKFSQPGDAIEMRGREEGREIVVEVADTGAGIPAEDLLHVWEELYRGQNVREVGGSGLGLALVRAIITRHDGQASLSSEVGQGTLLALRLPVSQATRT